MKTIAALLVPFLLAACASPRPAPPPAPHVVYSCDDGLTLRVRFARDGAHVTMPSGEQFHLPRQPDTPEGTYATPHHELTGSGDQALWRVGRRVPVGCRVVR